MLANFRVQCKKYNKVKLVTPAVGQGWKAESSNAFGACHEAVA